MCHLVVGHNDDYVVQSQNTLNFLYICYNVLQNSVLLMLFKHKIGGVFGLRSCAKCNIQVIKPNVTFFFGG